MFSFAEARELVLDTYQSFSPEAGKVTRRFFDERWIDAPARPHKRGGAFCAYTVPSVHPYVLLNFTARRRDVLTMAHELGHGLHAALAQPQGVFHQSTPLTLAETASVFGEALVFGRMLAEAARRRAAPRPARRADRRRDRDRVPPDGDEPLRAPGPHPPAQRGRAVGRPHRRVVGRDPERAVRRLGRDHRRLPDVVVLRAPLHQHARLRVRVRLRAAAGAVGLRPLPATRASRSSRATSSCSRPAARAAPRSWPRSSASTSPIPASGTPASRWSRSSSPRPRSSPPEPQSAPD